MFDGERSCHRDGDLDDIHNLDMIYGPDSEVMQRCGWFTCRREIPPGFQQLSDRGKFGGSAMLLDA